MTSPHTERQKMLAGLPYDSRDPELIARYHVARRLMRDLMLHDTEDAEGRRALTDALFGSVGPGTWIEAPIFVDYGENIAIGRDCFINGHCVFLDCAPITIGDETLIGPAVQIYTATHPLPADARILPSGRYVTAAQPIRIGARCWIGGGAILLPGVEIGDGTTIGAGSVVTRNVPAGVFAAGNPCRIVRSLA